METINKDVKTLLAKLLATEDISVVHKNMPTASVSYTHLTLPTKA